jgi:hypothetical protein
LCNSGGHFPPILNEISLNTKSQDIVPEGDTAELDKAIGNLWAKSVANMHKHIVRLADGSDDKVVVEGDEGEGDDTDGEGDDADGKDDDNEYGDNDGEHDDSEGDNEENENEDGKSLGLREILKMDWPSYHCELSRGIRATAYDRYRQSYSQDVYASFC